MTTWAIVGSIFLHINDLRKCTIYDVTFLIIILWKLTNHSIIFFVYHPIVNVIYIEIDVLMQLHHMPKGHNDLRELSDRSEEICWRDSWNCASRGFITDHYSDVIMGAVSSQIVRWLEGPKSDPWLIMNWWRYDNCLNLFHWGSECEYIYILSKIISH